MNQRVNSNKLRAWPFKNKDIYNKAQAKLSIYYLCTQTPDDMYNRINVWRINLRLWRHLKFGTVPKFLSTEKDDGYECEISKSIRSREEWSLDMYVFCSFLQVWFTIKGVRSRVLPLSWNCIFSEQCLKDLAKNLHRMNDITYYITEPFGGTILQFE